MVSLHTETARFRWLGHKNEFCFFRNTLMRSVGFTTILDGIAWNFQINSILAENEIKSSSTFPSRKFQVQSARFRELQHEFISKPLLQIGSEVKHLRFQHLRGEGFILCKKWSFWWLASKWDILLCKMWKLLVSKREYSIHSLRVHPFPFPPFTWYYFYEQDWLSILIWSAFKKV